MSGIKLQSQSYYPAMGTAVSGAGFVIGLGEPLKIILCI